MREVRRWVAEDADQSLGAEFVENEAIWFGDLIDLLKVDRRLVQPVINGLVEELGFFASRQRAAARLDRADRAARILRMLADRLLREFPNDPSAHRLMYEALLQDSKNAWKRDDLPGVRRSLEASISSLRRALELDPADVRIRSILIDQSRRLAALPPA